MASDQVPVPSTSSVSWLENVFKILMKLGPGWIIPYGYLSGSKSSLLEEMWDWEPTHKGKEEKSVYQSGPCTALCILFTKSRTSYIKK